MFRADALAAACRVLVAHDSSLLEDATFLSVCEAVWPRIDPADAVRDPAREFRALDGETCAHGGAAYPPGNPLRGMMAEMCAVAALAPKCADRLRSLYYDRRLLVPAIANVQYSTCYFEDPPAAARSALALHRRYGHAAVRHCFRRVGSAAGASAIEDPRLRLDLLCAVEFKRKYVAHLIQRTMESDGGDFLLACVERVQRDGEPLRDPAPLRLAMALNRYTYDYTLSAVTRADARALRLIAESDVFGNVDHHGAYGNAVWSGDWHEGRMLCKRAEMLLAIAEAPAASSFEDARRVVEAIAPAGDEGAAPSGDLYVCAAMLAANDRWAAVRLLTRALRSRGGVSRFGSSPDDRRVAANYMCRALSKSCANAVVYRNVRNLLLQMKVEPLSSTERWMLEEGTIGVEGDVDLWGADDGDYDSLRQWRPPTTQTSDQPSSPKKREAEDPPAPPDAKRPKID